MNKDKKTIDFDINFTDFPFDREKLRSIFTEVDKETPTINRKKKPKGALKMSIIISSIIAFITGSLIVLNTGNTETGNKINSGTSEVSVITKAATPIPATELIPEKTENKTQKKTIEQDVITSNGINNSTDTTLRTKRVDEQDGKQFPKMKYPVYFLSAMELEKLNIFRTEGGVALITESKFGYGYETRHKDKLAEMGYPGAGIFHELTFIDSFRLFKQYLLPYQDWSFSKSEGIYPYFLTGRYFKPESRGYSKTFFGDSPLIDITNKKAQDEDIYELSLEIIDSIYNKDKPVLSDQVIDITANEYENLDKFVPICFVVGSKNNGIFAVLWYPSTKYLLERLPQRMKDYYNKHYFEDKLVDYKPKLQTLPDIKLNSEDATVFVEKSIGGIENIELEKDELSRLGIDFGDSSVTVIYESKVNISKFPYEYRNKIIEKFQEQGYDVSKPILLVKTKNIMNKEGFSTKDGFEQVPVRYTGWDYNGFSKTAPIATSYYFYWEYTADKTQTLLFLRNNFSDYSPLLDSIKNSNKLLGIDKFYNFKPTTDRIIPVLIKYSKANSDSSQINWLFVKIWFYVNREFAELLPERYRIPIMKELDLIDEMEKGRISPEDACEALKGEKSYFNLCKINSGIIRNFYVTPNPVEGNIINIKLELTQKSTLSFDLYDLQGQLIKNIIPVADYEAGLISKTASLDIDKGIYILAVSSSAGDRQIVKIIK